MLTKPIKLLLFCLSLTKAQNDLKCKGTSDVIKPHLRVVIKDACCPDNPSGKPYNSGIRGCCCGKTFNLDRETCCMPNGSCDGTEKIIREGNICEKSNCKTDPDPITEGGEQFDCTGNGASDTCTLDPENACGEDYILVDKDGIVETTVTATCDNSFNWITSLPRNLCCVKACPPIPDTVKLDVIMVIDKSSSIGNANFEVVKEFLRRMVDILPVGSPQANARLSMITYNRIVERVITLEDSTTNNAEQLKQMIDNIVYNGRGTYTANALKHILENDMSDVNLFNRAAVPDVILVVTDGASRGNELLAGLSEQLEAKNAEIYAIGVGNANESELRDMASDPIDEHMKMVGTFDELGGVTDEFMSNYCEEYSCE